MAPKEFQVANHTFTDTITKIRDTPILVVGDVGVDRYTIGEATRLNPEAPVPIVSVESIQGKLGLAANVANNLAAFASAPFLAGVIGTDGFGDDLLGMLREHRINHDLVLRSADRRTTVKERVIAMGQQIVRVDHEQRSPINSQDAEKLLRGIAEVLPKMKAMIIEDYAKGIITHDIAQALIALAKKHQVFVAVDPPSISDRSRIDFYRGASMITPNLREAEKLYGRDIHTEEDLLRCGNELKQELACEILVITRGKDGMTLFTNDFPPMHVPTFAREVFDVSGAGDTVVAMLTVAIASGVELKTSAVMANYAAGAGVGIRGTAVIPVADLEAYIRQVGGFAN